MNAISYMMYTHTDTHTHTHAHTEGLTQLETMLIPADKPMVATLLFLAYRNMGILVLA